MEWSEFLWQGPPVEIVDAVKDFKKKYKSTITKSGRLFAKVKRSERRPEQVLKRVLSDEYVKSRVQRVKL